ncbi:MAG: hypothetical protein K1000chlam2_01750 [Chlamydiae bacterium]|nr:hypothetical protein [Chlamydiota bacterium]
MKRKFKRTFVLLEILIAFALVSISILPFLRYPYQYMKKEIDILFEMELEQLAQKTLAQLHMALYQEENDLVSPKQSNKIEVTLPRGMKRTYLVKAKVKWKKQKRDKDNNILRSLVDIKLDYYYQNKNKLSAIIEVIVTKKEAPNESTLQTPS